MKTILLLVRKGQEGRDFMEHKRFLKILSVIMAMLMVLSCMTTALIVAAEEVNEMTPVKTAKEAIDTWIASGETSATDYAVYNTLEEENNYYAYVFDKTSKGYIYDIAKALIPLVNQEISFDAEEGVNSMSRMRDRVKELTGYTTGPAAAVINAVLPDTMEYDADFRDSIYIIGDRSEFVQARTTTVEIGITVDAALARADKALSEIDNLPVEYMYTFDVKANSASATMLSRGHWYSFDGEFVGEELTANETLEAMKTAYNYFSSNMGDFNALIAANKNTYAEDKAQWDALVELGISKNIYDKYFGAVTPAAIADYLTASAAANEVFTKREAVERFNASQLVDVSAYTLDEVNAFYSQVKADYDFIVYWGYVDARNYFADNFGYDVKAWSTYMKSLETAVDKAEIAGLLPEIQAIDAQVETYIVQFASQEEMEAATTWFKAELTNELLAGFYNQYTAIVSQIDAYSLAAKAEFTRSLGFYGMIESEAAKRGIDPATGLVPAAGEGTTDPTATQRGWPGFTKNDLTNGTGVFCVREAEGYHNVPGYATQVRYADIARHDGETDKPHGDDYTVRDLVVEAVLENLDAWLASDEFSQLLSGLLDLGEEYTEVENLTELICAIFNKNVFCDDVLNAVMTMLYKDLAKKLPDILLDALANAMNPGQSYRYNYNNSGPYDPNGTTPPSQNYVYLYIGDASIASNTRAWLRMNGLGSSYNLEDIFAGIGLNLYPQQIVSYFNARGFPGIASLLSQAGKRASEIRYENGVPYVYSSWDNPILPVDEDGTFAFEWGVNDFAGFKRGFAAMVSGIAPLLKTVLFNVPYDSGVITHIVDADIKAKVLWEQSINNVDLQLVLQIAGVTGYYDVIAPLFEQLGVPASQIPNISCSSGNSRTDTTLTVNTMVNAILDPLWWFIQDLTTQPLNKVINLLPTLAYSIKNFTLESLLSRLALNIHWYVHDIAGGGLLGEIVSWFRRYFKGDIPLNLFSYEDPDSGMVKLYEILEMDNYQDMRDINKVLNAVLKLVASDEEEGTPPVTIKPLNQNILAALGSDVAYTSKRTGACINNYSRKIVADKSDVFYYVFNWLFSNYGNVDDLKELIGVFADNIEFPEIVEDLINNLGANPNDCLSALVEMFYPQEYGYQHITYNTNFDTFDGQNESGSNVTTHPSLCYLKYSNMWTEDKAAEFYNTADEFLDNLLKTISNDENFTLDSVVDGLLGKIFNTDTLHSLTSLVAGLAELEQPGEIDPETGEPTKPVLGPGIVQLIEKELGGSFTDFYGQYMPPEGADEDWKYDWGFEIINADDPDRTEDIIASADFFSALSTLIMPVAPLLAMLLGGQEWRLLTGVLPGGTTTKLLRFIGYEGYREGLVPLYEMLGLTPGDINADTLDGAFGFMAWADFNNWAAIACADSSTPAQKQEAYEWIINAVLNPVIGVLDKFADNPIDYFCTTLPNIMYQVQTDAFRDYIFNTLQGLIVILDTVRPIIDVDLPFIAELLEPEEPAPGEEEEPISPILQGFIDYCYNHTIKDILTFKGLLDALGEMFGLTLTNLVLEAINGTLLLGGVETYTSSNGKTIYKALVNTTVTTADANLYQPWDVMTVLAEVILEILQTPGNADAIELLIGGDFVNVDEETGDITPKGILSSLVGILNSKIEEDAYATIDWLAPFDVTYYDIVAGSYDMTTLVPADGSLDRINAYLQYNTNWTEDLADYLDINLANIADAIVRIANDDETATLGSVIDGLIAENLTGAMLNDIFGQLVGMFNNIDAYLATIDLFFGIDLTGLTEDYEPYPDDQIFTLTEFIGELETQLAPVSKLLDWLLLGVDYEFFNGSDYVEHYDDNYQHVKQDGESIIRIAGGNGWDTGVVPFLEAITRPVGKNDLVKNAAAIRAEIAGGAEGAALHALVDPLVAVAEMAADNPIDTIMDVLNNLFYFLNVGGLTAFIDNSLVAIFNIADVVNASGLLEMIDAEQFENGLYGVINERLTFKDEDDNVLFALDIKNLDLDLLSIIDIISAVTGLNLDTLKNFFDHEYYLGYLDFYVSTNGSLAGMLRFVDYVDQYGYPNVDFNGEYFKGTRSDFITVMVCLLLDVIEEAGNRDPLIELLAGVKADDDEATVAEKMAKAEAMYEALADLLDGDPGEIEPDPYDWDTFIDGVEVDPSITSADMCYLKYNTNWNRTTAKYVYDNFNDIADAILRMVDEDNPQTLEGLIDGLLYENIFTAETVNKLYDAIIGFYDTINDNDADGHIFNVLNLALDLDLSTYAEIKAQGPYVFNEYLDAQEQFIDAIVELLAPFEPLLEFLFAGKDLALFTDYDETEPQIVLKGAYGYQDGLITLYEAFNMTPMDPADFAIALAAHDGSGIRAILEPVVNFIDDIAEAPVQEIAKLLPQIIFFLQSGNLKVSVTNILGAVNNLLDRIKPIYDVDLEGLVIEGLGIELAEGTTIWDMVAYDNLINLAENATGMELSTIVDEAIKGIYFPDHEEPAQCIINKTTGKVQFIDGKFEEYDSLTLLISVAIELLMYKDEAAGIDNALALETLINKDCAPGEEKIPYGTIDMIFTIFDTEITGLMGIDWFYFDEDFVPPIFAAGEPIDLPPQSIVYLDNYASTNWDRELVNYIDSNLESIVDSIIKLIYKDKPEAYTCYTDLMAGKIDALFSDDIINGIVGAILPLLGQIDAALLDTVGIVLNIDLSYYENLTGDEEWGVTDIQSFIQMFKLVLAPLAPALNWLLLDGDYTFFSGSEHTVGDGEALITINGADGYDYGVVPLLEALVGTAGIDVKSGAEIKAENEALVAAGKDPTAVISAILEPLGELLKLIEGEDYITTVIDLINNIFYYINANGVSASINNMFIAVLSITDTLNNTGLVELDLVNMLNDLINEAIGITTFDLRNIDIKTICDIIYEVVGFEVYQYIGAFLENYFIGHLEMFLSANAQPAVRLVLNDIESGELGTRGDFLTCLISLALDTVEDPANRDKLIELIADVKEDDDDATRAEKIANATNTVNAIIALLNGDPGDIIPDDFDFDSFIDGVEQDDTITSADMCYLRYNNNWNRETASYVYENANEVINGVLKLVDSENPKTIEGIMEDLLYDNLYTEDLANKAFDAIIGLYDTIREVDTDGHIFNVIKHAIGVDFNAYKNIKLHGHYEFNEATPAEDQFVDALVELLTPFEPILEFLFAGKDIKFFVDGDDTSPQIVIKGAYGYRHGLIKLLEALNIVPVSANTFEAHIALHDGSGIRDLLNPIVAFLEAVAAAPVEEVAKLLPQLIYFLQSGNLEIAVTNMLGAVYALFDRIKPIYDVDLEALIVDGLNIELEAGETLWDYLAYDNLINLAETATGMELSTIVDEAINGTYFPNSDDPTQCIINRTTGKVQYIPGKFEEYDALTLLISVALELLLYKDEGAGIDNAHAFEAFINKDCAPGEEKIPYGAIDAIAAIFFEEIDGLMGIDWFYFDPYFVPPIFAEGATLDTPEQSIVYLDNYASTNWDKEFVDYLDENFEDIMDWIVTLVYKDRAEGYTSVAEVHAGILERLFSDDMINDIVGGIVPLVEKIDQSLLDTVGLLLNVDLSYYQTLTGEETWGVTDVASFVDTLEFILAPLSPVLNWLLLGENYAFFNGSDHVVGDGNDIITIQGANGYDYGVIPLLEALVGTAGVNVKSLAEVKAENEALVATGKEPSAVIAAILDPLADMLNLFGTDDYVDALISLINNLFYYVNANGVSASVNNMFIAVLHITDALTESGVVDADLIGMINDLVNDSLNMTTFDLMNIDIKTICDIVFSATGGFDTYNYVGEFLENYFIGHLEMFMSKNAQPAVRLVINETGGGALGTRGDFLTCLISLTLETFEDPTNEAILTSWFGGNANIYQGILNILSIKDYGIYDDIDWLFTDEIAPGQTEGTTVHSPIRNSTSLIRYGKYWTREKAEYVDSHLESCIDAVLHLLGVEMELGGLQIDLDSLETALQSLVAGELYTQKLANRILNKILDILGQLEEIDTEGYIEELIKRLIDVDLSEYDGFYYDYDWGFEDGDRAGFVNALLEMFMPLEPVLRWLFFDDDWALFVEEDGMTQINLPGGYGYKYGIIPILEALQCDNILTQEEYEAAYAADSNNLILAFVNPLLDRIDKVLEDPANEIMDLLPSVIYFIESDGLSACWENLLHGVYIILEAISPIYEVDLAMLLFKMDIHTIEQGGELDIAKILESLLDSLEERTGFTFTDIAVDLLSDLSTGTVYKFQSKNGRTAYSMRAAKSAEDAIGDRADLITAILCIAMEFIATGDNAQQLKALVSESIDEEAAKYVNALIDTLYSAVKSDPVEHVDIMLGTLWYVFYGADIAAESADEWLTDFNNDWQFIIDLMGNAETDVIASMGKIFAGVLDTYLDDIFDSEGLASNGLISFFQRLKAFFQKIIDFFKNLFA